VLILVKFYHLNFHVLQVKLNIQKLRDTQKTLTQSVGQYNALVNSELTDDQLNRTTPIDRSDFQQVQLLNVRPDIL